MIQMSPQEKIAQTSGMLDGFGSSSKYVMVTKMGCSIQLNLTSMVTYH